MSLKTTLFSLTALGVLALGVLLVIPSGGLSLGVSSVLVAAIVVVFVKGVVFS